ncbi:MAG TPA: aldolase/citrate lyase family protein [Bryobacteraceae bacterium]|jgi:2-keto-3-deoxy-L-rhamnonate aldolase RhmA|nr:aldolase/citrate lyase family protein [Bryobacteraceae bacterium]
MRTNTVKQALKEGKTQFGCNTSMLRSPEVPRILAAAGLDWSYLDSEHGGFDLETLQDLIRAANEAGLCPIVRVADLQYPLVARALDCGAQGVLFPRVESPELLERAISWTRFPPEGVRGYGLQPTHVGYEAVGMPDIIAHSNANTMVVLQIETRTALERIDELLSVPKIDAVMIGPADLSISLGVAGQFEHPTLVAAIEKIRDACIRHGIAPGIHMRSLKLVQYWRDRGMLFLSCNSEIGFMLEKATETVAALKS